MTQDNNAAIYGYISSLRDAFEIAAELDTGMDRAFFQHTFRLVAVDLDRARGMAARGEGAAAIDAAGSAASVALNRMEQTVPRENLSARQAYFELALIKQTESAKLGDALTEKLQRQVKEAQRLFAGEPPASFVSPPAGIEALPITLSGRKPTAYEG